jgi:hypothetical protein
VAGVGSRDSTTDVYVCSLCTASSYILRIQRILLHLPFFFLCGQTAYRRDMEGDGLRCLKHDMDKCKVCSPKPVFADHTMFNVPLCLVTLSRCFYSTVLTVLSYSLRVNLHVYVSMFVDVF